MGTGMKQKKEVAVFYQGDSGKKFAEFVKERLEELGHEDHLVTEKDGGMDLKTTLDLVHEAVVTTDCAIALVTPDDRDSATHGNVWMEIGYWTAARTKRSLLVAVHSSVKPEVDLDDLEWVVDFDDEKQLQEEVTTFLDNLKYGPRPSAAVMHQGFDEKDDTDWLEVAKGAITEKKWKAVLRSDRPGLRALKAEEIRACRCAIVVVTPDERPTETHGSVWMEVGFWVSNRGRENSGLLLCVQEGLNPPSNLAGIDRAGFTNDAELETHIKRHLAKFDKREASAAFKLSEVFFRPDIDRRVYDYQRTCCPSSLLLIADLIRMRDTYSELASVLFALNDLIMAMKETRRTVEQYEPDIRASMQQKDYGTAERERQKLEGALETPCKEVKKAYDRLGGVGLELLNRYSRRTDHKDRWDKLKLYLEYRNDLGKQSSQVPGDQLESFFEFAKKFDFVEAPKILAQVGGSSNEFARRLRESSETAISLVLQLEELRNDSFESVGKVLEDMKIDGEHPLPQDLNLIEISKRIHGFVNNLAELSQTGKLPRHWPERVQWPPKTMSAGSN